MMALRSILAALSALAVAGACSSVETERSPTPDAVPVVIETSLGLVFADIYPELAPASAGDFLRYVDEGRYDGKASGFYRVVRPDNDRGAPIISVIQGGLIDESAPIAPVPHETTVETGLRHTDGTLSLARFDPGSGSAAAFFITIGDQPSLDFGGMRNPDGQGFAAFGRVTAGMDVVREINALTKARPTDDAYVVGQMLAEPILFSVRRADAP